MIKGLRSRLVAQGYSGLKDVEAHGTSSDLKLCTTFNVGCCVFGDPTALGGDSGLCCPEAEWYVVSALDLYALVVEVGALSPKVAG